MATYTWREVVTRRVEYAVPSGSPAGEFDKTWAAARGDYRQRNGLADAATSLPDHWARVEARDEEVVIVFDIKEPADADRQRVEAVRVAYAEVLGRLQTKAGRGPGGQLVEEDLAPIGYELNRVVNGR